MICELCGKNVNKLPVECETPKNGSCAGFLIQAEQDAKIFNMHRSVHRKTLLDLKPGDTFRYKGSEDDDWHTVTRIDEDKLYYPGYLADKPQSNYRVENVEVILK